MLTIDFTWTVALASFMGVTSLNIVQRERVKQLWVQYHWTETKGKNKPRKKRQRSRNEHGSEKVVNRFNRFTTRFDERCPEAEWRQPTTDWNWTTLSTGKTTCNVWQRLHSVIVSLVRSSPAGQIWCCLCLNHGVDPVVCCDRKCVQNAGPFGHVKNPLLR